MSVTRLTVLLLLLCTFGASAAQKDDELSISKPTRFLIYNGSRNILECQQLEWNDPESIYDCKISEGYALNDVVRIFVRAMRENSEAQYRETEEIRKRLAAISRTLKGKP